MHTSMQIQNDGAVDGGDADAAFGVLMYARAVLATGAR